MTKPLPPPACPPPPRPPADAPHIPAEGRDARGRILPGFGGRKKGTRNKRSAEAEAAIQNMAGLAVTSLKPLVRRGNWPATKYVLDAVLPALGRTIELENATPDALLQAVAAGELSPTEFGKLSIGFKAAMDASELKELKNQVDELEQLIGALKR